MCLYFRICAKDRLSHDAAHYYDETELSTIVHETDVVQCNSDFLIDAVVGENQSREVPFDTTANKKATVNKL